MGRKTVTAANFHLGARNIPWWAIGVSVVATCVSALSFLGGPAWSYADGMSALAAHMNYPLAVFAVTVVFLPFFYNSGAPSIYDYMERRFGFSARTILSVLFLVTQTLTSAAILYATALILEFITGIDVAPIIIAVAAVALACTVMGGISAVIWTNLAQASALCVDAVIILFSLLSELPTPLLDTMAELKAEGKVNPLDFTAGLSRETSAWSGLIAMTLFHITVYGANQMMMQRSLAAKNIGDAKKAYLVMGFGAFFIYFPFILLGVLLYSHYDGREFESGNAIILQFAADIGIPGLMGILAAAVMAASLSSLDSSLNSLATVTVVDFHQKRFRPDESDRHYLLVSRLSTVFWAALIVVPAIMYAGAEGSILKTLSKVVSYFVGAKLGMYALGFFSRHTSERGLIAGVVVGFAVVWAVAANTDISWPWYGVIGAGVNIVVSVLASLALDGRQASWHPYTVAGQRRRFAAEGLPEKVGGWYQLPGKVDPACYGLLVFFVVSFLFLLSLQSGL